MKWGGGLWECNGLVEEENLRMGKGREYGQFLCKEKKVACNGIKRENESEWYESERERAYPCVPLVNFLMCYSWKNNQKSMWETDMDHVKGILKRE